MTAAAQQQIPHGAQRTAPPAGGPLPEKPKMKPIEVGRMKGVAFVHGDPIHVTLPDGEMIEEGEQDVNVWQNIAGMVGVHQWIEVTNDFGSAWRLMRVEMMHGNPSTGLRALRLRDIVPPVFRGAIETKISATGDWQVLFLGAHRKWVVVSPQGVIQREGINTELDAYSHRAQQAMNPRPQ